MKSYFILRIRGDSPSFKECTYILTLFSVTKVSINVVRQITLKVKLIS